MEPSKTCLRCGSDETVENICCAQCGECYPLSEAETRTEAV
jgi:hypothetical protein